ncbi:uncharacterized protein FFMR_04440 [Fusarium fujikuroi]|uniref:Uncharacterized protein n=1 Tax=Fusarium fujikuroi TaxID=5127 RepID=A0A9Q9RXA7_FUSFU|nr:uncharacterized protein FFMR_04440 [Fusarium fujikuroi]VTT80309.1 unnamed protein product [Fusarium fujikuroi]VZI00939.1 unnamed protein product [Fusarium fujikuroi]
MASLAGVQHAVISFAAGSGSGSVQGVPQRNVWGIKFVFPVISHAEKPHCVAVKSNHVRSQPHIRQFQSMTIFLGVSASRRHRCSLVGPNLDAGIPMVCTLRRPQQPLDSLNATSIPGSSTKFVAELFLYENCFKHPS